MSRVAADLREAEIDAIRHDILEAVGATQPEVRALVMNGGAPEGMADYLDKVRRASYRVTDDDIQSLMRLGLSEDVIFELTVAACVGIAYERREFARRALGLVT